MKGTNFLPEIAINHKKSIFSKGHDAKTFWGIIYYSTHKNDSNKPQFVMVYGTSNTFIILNKCVRKAIKPSVHNNYKCLAEIQDENCLKDDWNGK